MARYGRLQSSPGGWQRGGTKVGAGVQAKTNVQDHEGTSQMHEIICGEMGSCGRQRAFTIIYRMQQSRCPTLELSMQSDRVHVIRIYYGVVHTEQLD